MDADQLSYRFADDNRLPQQARCRRNQVAGQEEPPSGLGRTAQQECRAAARKQSEMLAAALAPAPTRHHPTGYACLPYSAAGGLLGQATKEREKRLGSRRAEHGTDFSAFWRGRRR